MDVVYGDARTRRAMGARDADAACALRDDEDDDDDHDDDERLFAGRRREDDATTTRGLTTRRRSRRAVSNALFELTALAGLDVRREVHDAVLELSRARVVPTATAQVLRSLASKAADARAAGLEDALRAPARE